MTVTFREYVFDNLNNNLACLRLAENSECWPYEGGDLLNWRSMRMATPEEKKAVEAKVDLDLKATQKALKIAGENPLTPSEAKEFWKIERFFHIYSDVLSQTLDERKKHEEALANAQNPDAYKKELVDNLAQKKLADWRSYNEQKNSKATQLGWTRGLQNSKDR